MREIFSHLPSSREEEVEESRRPRALPFHSSFRPSVGRSVVGQIQEARKRLLPSALDPLRLKGAQLRGGRGEEGGGDDGAIRGGRLTDASRWEKDKWKKVEKVLYRRQTTDATN